MDRQRIRIVFLALLCALLLAGVALAQGSQPHGLPWHVVASGGGHMASSRHGLDGSAGQPAIGLATGQYHRLGAGYWYGVVEVGPVIRIYLPFIVKNP